MDFFILLLFISNSVWECGGVSLRKQLEHIAERRRESQAIIDLRPKRRYYDFHPGRWSTIIGSPSEASHLPEAEAILPGHTLIRPALDMLKSAIKFPHRDLEDGSGVYGNIDSLGIRYGGRNERVLYTGFRRTENDELNTLPMDDSIEYHTMSLSSLPRNLRNIIENILLSIRKGDERKKRIEMRVPSGLKNINVQRNYNLRSNHGIEKNYKARANGSGLHKTFPDITNIGSDEAQATRHSSHLVTSSSEEGDGIKLFSNPENHEHSGKFDGIKKTGNEQLIVKDPKKTWFWNSMNTFDHVRINQDAPDINELAPPLKLKNKRHWWYYHKGDFVPFDSLQ